MIVETYAAIDPVTKRCRAIGEVDVELIMESFNEGWIIVPVTVETARQIWGKEPIDVFEIAQKS
ncbi:hypothetical protein [Pseudomonas sp. HN8-3]|uniref:hypothetical protein n=1 Tax=Pseudomonas sp. HN8-3 TaxID=2886361 RepID=UPI001E38BC50|nr:hypothetical protein [Pseudomonas sp. HN8-3]UEH06333.1 hypothetical protein LJX92_15295 [Pseudomonas sp. HN8-3]